MAERRVLLAFHTVEGQTAKIAQRIAQVLRDAHLDVDVRSVDVAPPPDGYDAAVLGDSIHAVHHSRALRRYLREHAASLDAMPTALFQVSLASANPDEKHTETAHHMVEDLMEDTGLAPDVVGMFAGNLAYTKYGWFTKRVMRAIVKREGGNLDMSEDHEYTDWDAVEQFARDVAAVIASSDAT